MSESLVLSLTVPPEHAGERLDAFLASEITQTSRSQIRRAIVSGDITVNNATVKPSYSIRAGEEIQVEFPKSAPLEAAPEPIPLDIIYEDEAIIVINKPAGMVTHPGAGVASGTLANGLVYHFAQISHQPPRRGGASRPGIVHRLDVGTSGLIVVAKTDRAHLSLAEQFESRTVFKSYSALVYGSVKENEGRIDVPIGRDPSSRVKMAVRPAGVGRPALTTYRVLERFDLFTLLDVEIKTGRTHQIRVHLAHIKYPVVGDGTYDGGRSNTIKNSQIRAAIAKLGRPFLHAARLSIVHPVSGEKMDFTAPFPKKLQTFLGMLHHLSVESD
ncbi:MAG: RluA family pseudouridine synthase [Acidobacteria bacterium]|nr:RluA family pseudouridine synthase [Acidobacteriota bacterium]